MKNRTAGYRYCVIFRSGSLVLGSAFDAQPNSSFITPVLSNEAVALSLAG